MVRRVDRSVHLRQTVPFHAPSSHSTHLVQALPAGGIYHYLEVVGGPGKTQDGYQIVINFLNDAPVLDTWHNYKKDTSGLTGTWCRYEVSTPISEDEFQEALQRALNHPGVQIW